MLTALLIGTHVLAFLIGGALAWRVAHRRGWRAGLRSGVDLATRTEPNEARAFFDLGPIGVEVEHDR